MTVGPILELEAGDALELPLIIGYKNKPRGFGVSSNPEIVTTDQLTLHLKRCPNLAVSGRSFSRHGKYGQQ